MKKANEPVNPIIGSIGHEDYGGKPVYMIDNGLKKREYFAGLAMQGILASDEVSEFLAADKVAKKAVEYADALLAELDK